MNSLVEKRDSRNYGALKASYAYEMECDAVQEARLLFA